MSEKAKAKGIVFSWKVGVRNEAAETQRLKESSPARFSHQMYVSPRLLRVLCFTLAPWRGILHPL